jgi:hypothetical protein
MISGKFQFARSLGNVSHGAISGTALEVTGYPSGAGEVERKMDVVGGR